MRFKRLSGIASAVLLGAAVALFSGATGARAQSFEQASPVLSEIVKRNAVRIGYRENLLPFSIRDKYGRLVGYSIELCNEIIADIRIEVNKPELEVRFVPISTSGRVPAIEKNEIDLECGSSTITPERAEKVAFSPVIFLTGTRLLVSRSATYRNLSDMRGKKIVVMPDTTNEQVIRELNTRNNYELTISHVPTPEACLLSVTKGQADACASDDILLAGQVALMDLHREVRIIGDLLSYESYGIMYPRRDDRLADTVRGTFRRLAVSGDLKPLYERWFLKRLPNGVRLSIPMSSQLEQSFRFLDETAK